MESGGRGGGREVRDARTTADVEGEKSAQSELATVTVEFALVTATSDFSLPSPQPPPPNLRCCTWL